MSIEIVLGGVATRSRMGQGKKEDRRFRLRRLWCWYGVEANSVEDITMRAWGRPDGLPGDSWGASGGGWGWVCGVRPEPRGTST